VETELKFQVPAQHRAALLKAVATASAATTRLQAVYADTADQRLAAAGLALRLRKEGRRWVQTLKGRAEGAGGLMQRLEHEVPLAGLAGGAEPALDPSRHAGTPVGERLLALLADGAPLLPVYRTDVRRVHRVTSHGGARIELAYDRGQITAGDRVLPVDELELELVRGPASALPALAARWAGRFGLWWDIRTKSERGFRLARGQDAVPAATASVPRLQPGTTPAEAFAAATGAALQQALANACEIASGTGAPEHLHQLRVGLRRLRSLLRVLGPWSADPAAAAQLEDDWRAPFARLGACRDGDVFVAEWLPPLQAAGAPALALPASTAGEDPALLVRAPEFQALLLRSLALLTAETPAEPAPITPPTLAEAAPAAIARLWKQVRRGARAFGEADTAARHQLRKRLKRLRYVLEPLEPLLRRRAGTALLKALRRALQSLGELNDLATAEAAFRARAEAEPALWFAVGWLRARHDTLLPRAGADLAALAELKLRWR
jgi:triphosphatase